METIIAFSDDGTWETLNDEIKVWTITDEGLEELCEGGEPRHLEDEHVVLIAPLIDFIQTSSLIKVAEDA